MEKFPLRQLLTRMFKTMLNANTTDMNMTSMVKSDVAMDDNFYTTTVSQLNYIDNDTESPDKKMIVLIMTIVVFCFPVVTICFVLLLRMHLKWRENEDASRGLMRGTFELSSIMKSSRQNTVKVRMDLDELNNPEQEVAQDNPNTDSNGPIMNKDEETPNEDTGEVHASNDQIETNKPDNARKERVIVEKPLPTLSREKSCSTKSGGDSGVDFSLSPDPTCGDNHRSIPTRFNFDTAVIKHEIEIH